MPKVVEWVESDPVESYFRVLADRCADYWHGKLNTAVTDKDLIQAHALKRLSQEDENLSLSEAGRFREAVYQHCLETLKGWILPKYRMDYSAVDDLEVVLETNGLTNINDWLPWKTKYTFDFSDAPALKWN